MVDIREIESPGDKRDADKRETDADDRRIEQKIDRDLEASFPASDPPGWTLGVGLYDA